MRLAIAAELLHAGIEGSAVGVCIKGFEALEILYGGLC